MVLIMEQVVNALSFDLEEWFQAEALSHLFPERLWPGTESRCESQTDDLLRLLAAAKTKATFFVVGWVAERKAALIRRAAAEGHEIACHGYSHRMATRMSRGEFGEDIRKAKSILEDLAGSEVRGYRAPTFSIKRENLWALDAVLEAGFSYDSSIYPIRHDRYGIPGSPRFPYPVLKKDAGELWEFPLTTISFAGLTLPAAGGGYLRLLPYGWTRMAMKKANRLGRPANVFAHPWEFDAALPRVDLPQLARYRHYGGIAGNRAKLTRLLDDFRCAPMCEIIDGFRRAAEGS